MTTLIGSGEDFVAMPSGLLLPERHVVAQLRQTRRPKAVDLFCGCGGFSLGLIQAGWEVVGAVELWSTAVITYMANLCRYGEVQLHFVTDEDRAGMEAELAKEYRRAGIKIVDGKIVEDGKIKATTTLVAGNGWIKHEPRSTPGVSHIIVGDAAKLKGQRLLDWIGMKRGELDAVVGGAPCQGFSVAGKRDVMDPRNSLIFEFARLIVELNPKTMVMENVLGVQTMMTPDGLPVLDVFCRILEDGGFQAIDMVRRMMKAQGLVVTRGKPKAKAASEPADDEGDQLSLFGGE